VFQKSILDIFDCNLKTNYQILIIFGTNIPDATCHQMIIQIPTAPNVCFCTTWGKHNQWNITFYPMWYVCLINITRKTFCLHFWHFGWHFIQLSIFTRNSSTAATAVARLSHRNSVRPSVCLSHGWISQKLCKLRSQNLHRQLPGRL